MEKVSFAYVCSIKFWVEAFICTFFILERTGQILQAFSRQMVHSRFRRANNIIRGCDGMAKTIWGMQLDTPLWSRRVFQKSFTRGPSQGSYSLPVPCRPTVSAGFGGSLSSCCSVTQIQLRGAADNKISTANNQISSPTTPPTGGQEGLPLLVSSWYVNIFFTHLWFVGVSNFCDLSAVHLLCHAF